MDMYHCSDMLPCMFTNSKLSGRYRRCGGSCPLPWFLRRKKGVQGIKCCDGSSAYENNDESDWTWRKSLCVAGRESWSIFVKLVYITITVGDPHLTLEWRNFDIWHPIRVPHWIWHPIRMSFEIWHVMQIVSIQGFLSCLLSLHHIKFLNFVLVSILPFKNLLGDLVFWHLECSWSLKTVTICM